MKQKSILIAFLVFALVNMACGVTINLPEDLKTGPTEVEEIDIPLPEDTGLVTDLTLSFAGGELALNPGAEGALVSGMATYNVPDFRPTVEISNNIVRLEQGDLNVTGIPNFDDKVINKWDVQLANVPMDLRIKCGAYAGKIELGGLTLQRLTIADGASDVHLSFSEPNRTEMDMFEYTTGASSVTLEKLGNANIDSFNFRAGAGSYTLDFSGQLQQDMMVSIESGISSITIIVPEGTAAEVAFEGGLSNVTTSGDWERNGNSYSLSGSGPVITIVVKMAAGNLVLRTE